MGFTVYQILIHGRFNKSEEVMYEVFRAQRNDRSSFVALTRPALLWVMVGALAFSTGKAVAQIQPELSKFAPLDQQDWVDHFTGDFRYTVPLIQVPGPNGGYPISLSYASGITPDQDASWVGLGW